MSHRYCGRDFHADDIAAIRQLIAEDSARTRAELSRLTCRALSMLLAMAAKALPYHWQEVYGYRPVLLETFVEKPRFRVIFYNAANWVYLGQTKGRGKLGPAGKQSVPIKD